MVKSMSGKERVEKVKKDIDKIETINIEQEHKHNDSLIAQINAKSVENSDLNAQLQEKVFAVSALKNELRTFKGKFVVDTTVSTPIVTTIAPGMFKLGIEPISHRLKNNRDVHEPSGNTKNNRISQPSSSNKTNKVEDQSRSIKSKKNKKNRVDKTECNAHVMQSMLNANSVSEPISCRIVSKFLGTIKFDNDHIAKIMGYGDYQMGNVTISRGSRGSNLYTLSLENLFLSSPIRLLSNASKTKSWLWHRRLSHLNFDYITSIIKQGLVRGLPKLKYQKDYLCSAFALETVVTACYTQNRSLIRKCHNKTPYELLHDRKPDSSYLHVFGALCYPTNDSEVLGKLKPKADIGIFVGCAPRKKAFRIYNKRTRLITKNIHVDFDELTAMASE
ncbi:retrovirus-related pol polyprotein from transposon TNT 1-94 [Tanacetum coccineum]